MGVGRGVGVARVRGGALVRRSALSCSSRWRWQGDRDAAHRAPWAAAARIAGLDVIAVRSIAAPARAPACGSACLLGAPRTPIDLFLQGVTRGAAPAHRVATGMVGAQVHSG